MKYATLLVIGILVFGINVKAQKIYDSKKSINQIRDVLTEFQDGYTKRDTSIIDQFMKIFSDDIVCMGTSSHEFFKGKKSVRRLTISDWIRWSDLKIPVEKVNIRVDNNVAWFEVVGASGPWRDGKTYEIRVVGSLVNNGQKWLFKQICYSYPAPLKVIK